MRGCAGGAAATWVETVDEAASFAIDAVADAGGTDSKDDGAGRPDEGAAETCEAGRGGCTADGTGCCVAGVERERGGACATVGVRTRALPRNFSIWPT